MTTASSFTPLSNTVWLPSEIPARLSRSSAATVAGVSSLAWLKCVFMKIGWYCCTISQNSGVTRSGRCAVMRLPMRMISTWGISRSFWKMYSSRRSLSIIGSPPDSTTSRTSVCALM